MGSSQRPKDANLPSSTQANGTEGLIQKDGDHLEEPVSLTIRLSRVNPTVHNKTKIGAPVMVKGKAVRVNAGILGYIPDNQYEAVQKRGLTHGQVEGLPEGENPSAIVVLTP